MDLGLTDDQRALRQMTRELLTTVCPPGTVRRADTTTAAVDQELWCRLADADLLRLVIPENHGGAGAGDVELTVLLEEAGRVALPGPLLETSVVALTLSELDPRQRWLPALGAGTTAATLALPEQPLVVNPGESGILLDATKDAIHLLSPERFHTTPVPAADGGRKLVRTTTRPGPDTALTGPPDATERLISRTAVGNAAQLLGLAAQMVAMTVAHVGNRHQFGRPIGSFQAVKHRLANAYRAVETARPAVWAAAQLLADRSPAAMNAAAVAAVAAIDAAATANEHALQCHGGIGFTLEHDLQLWLKRAKALERAYGTAQQHRRRLSTALFDTPGKGSP